MTTDTHHATRIALLAQEQQAQAQALVELRRVVQHLVQRVEVLEQETATLRAVWLARWTEGAE